jgi:hypothetical protein
VHVGDVKYVTWKWLQNDPILLAIKLSTRNNALDIRVPESAPPWLQTHQRYSFLCSPKKSTKVVRIVNTSE